MLGRAHRDLRAGPELTQRTPQCEYRKTEERIIYGLCFVIPLNRKEQQLDSQQHVRSFLRVSLNARDTGTHRNVWKRLAWGHGGVRMITRAPLSS